MSRQVGSKTRHIGWLLLLYGLWNFVPQCYGQQAATFHTQVNHVDVTAVVHSASALLVPNLIAKDFEILEDGVPQTIRSFSRETELPLSLGLLVDASGSQDRYVHQHYRDVATFLTAVLRPSDQVFAVCFGNHLRLVSDLTSSASFITDGLQRFAKGARTAFPEVGPREDRDLGTALYDAIYFSIQEKIAGNGDHRRALILFSDGEENSSEHDFLAAVEAAQRSDSLLYCIRYTPTRHGGLNARSGKSEMRFEEFTTWGINPPTRKTQDKHFTF